MRNKNFHHFLFCIALILIHQVSYSQISGIRLTGSTGITETVNQIMARETGIRETNLACIEADAGPIYPDRRNLQQNPLSPAVASFPINTAIQGPILPSSPQTLGTSFAGAGRTLDGISAVPPDNMGAIGPTQYITIVNGKIKTFNKSTGTLDGFLNTTDANFWTSVSNAVGVSDPRIRYDRKTGRWFVVEINVSNTLNRIMIAVSSGPNITGTASFTFYQFSTASGFDDYPTFGIDENALYIGTNNFSSSVGTFVKTNGYVIRKSDILTGTLTVTSFPGLGTASTAGPYTPQGVDNFDAAPTYGYFVGGDVLSYGILQIRRVSNAGTATPTISGNITLTVPTTGAPVTGVPFLGATGGRKLDDLDDRLFAAVIRNNLLWTAHNIQVNTSGVYNATGGRDGSRWYQIDVSTATPTLTQSGTIFDPAASNPVNYFIPSVSISGQGHAAFSLSSAGTAAFPNASTVGRLATDALGTTGIIVNTTSSSTTYNLQTGTERWGDYSLVTLDPIDDQTLWMINEYCDASSSWASRVTKLIAPPPATPALCTPNIIAKNQPSVNVTLTGTAVSGSGFYDPGSNLPSPALAFNHISAAVTGGVVVNSVTYTSPTSIVLNLNTMGAATGTSSITVTNPDGQSTTSASPILTITLPLPINTLGLTARLNNNLTVLLSWATATEQNNRGFYIERNESNDINNWQQVGFVAGAGTSVLTHNYSFTDNTISLGHMYKYRLRQVDIDNQFSFSNEVLVRVKDLNMLVLNSYPNPFHASTTLNYNLPSGGNMVLKIFNTVGIEMATLLNQYQQSGCYSLVFDADHYKLTPGVYYCTLIFGTEKMITKMIRVK